MTDTESSVYPGSPEYHQKGSCSYIKRNIYLFIVGVCWGKDKTLPSGAREGVATGMSVGH